MVEMIISLLKLVMSLENKSVNATLIYEFTFFLVIIRCFQSCEKNDIE